MKVTNWTRYRTEDEEWPGLERIPNNLFEEARKTIVDEMKFRGIRFSGEFHQNSLFGVPVLDDKYYFTSTWRAWGEMVAEAVDGDDDYFDWYMNSDEKPSVLPCPEWYGKEFWT